MKISYNWLKQYVNVELPVEKVSEILTDTGLEVEGVEKYQSVKGGLEGVVVGEVLTCEQHPNADRLKVTTVDIGEDEPVQIVCGAQNVKAGIKVPVATIGTVLYDGDKDFKIKKGKIRGEESHGMICAEDELGLGDSHDGILVMDDNAKVGSPVANYYDIENDNVIEIGLTPNRTDGMSHYGVARDLRAALLHQGESHNMMLPSVENFKVDNINLPIEVEVKDTEACPRYAGLTISGIEVKESPTWLQNRLKAIGLGPINNVVDVTNYVLHEIGHPLHAFDADKIKGNKIVVQQVKQDTKFVTLDETERKLDAADLMICNAEEGMCIAGVFGGLSSGVSKSTKNIFIESAYFNPVSIRKTAKRHGLNTDASFRYERGIDPNMTIYALKRAALLIQEIAGGEVSSEIVDQYPNPIHNFKVELSFENMKRLIGESIEKEVVKNILASLDIEVLKETEEGLSLSVPPYRADVKREADVIEEVLRIYGYNNIGFPTKLNTSLFHHDKLSNSYMQNLVSDLLSGNGFNEIMSNSLTKAEYADWTEDFKAEENVAMLNPLSQDLGVMRQTLLYGGLEAISYNNKRQMQDLKFYEFGKSYKKTEEGYHESRELMLFVTGNKQAETWEAKPQKMDFYWLKGMAEMVLTRLGIAGGIKYDQADKGFYADGLTAKLGKNVIVELGIVKKNILKKMDIKQEVFVAQFNWDTILRFVQKKKVSYTDIPKFPMVRRDLALLLDKEVQFSAIHDLAYKAERKILKDVNLFDVYEGDKLPEGKKSYAVSFTLQDPSKTLTDNYVDKVMSKLQETFEKELGATLR